MHVDISKRSKINKDVVDMFSKQFLRIVHFTYTLPTILGFYFTPSNKGTIIQYTINLLHVVIASMSCSFHGTFFFS